MSDSATSLDRLHESRASTYRAMVAAGNGLVCRDGLHLRSRSGSRPSDLEILEGECLSPLGLASTGPG